jgi:hypothetical protein
VTEAYDDFEDEDELENYDGDEELRDEIAELNQRLDEQEGLDEIDRVIRQMESEHGSRFSQAEVNQIGALLDQGYSPESVYEAVAPASAFEEAFDQSIEWLERQEGRTILFTPHRYSG